MVLSCGQGRTEAIKGQQNKTFERDIRQPWHYFEIWEELGFCHCLRKRGPPIGRLATGRKTQHEG